MNASADPAVLAELERLTEAFFRAVSFAQGARPSYADIHGLFVEAGILIKNVGPAPEISTVAEFIRPRQASVDAGQLTQFHESEIAAVTEVFGNVAHRFSSYAKSGTLNGTPFSARGMISTQFVNTPGGWKMSAMAWDDERTGLALPPRFESVLRRTPCAPALSRADSAASPIQVTLREITSETVRQVTRLSVAETQQGFVAPNAVSLAQALFSDEAWYRAVYVGEELVGFVMLADESIKKHPPAEPKIGLWRLMIDQRYQRRGIGREVMRLVLEHVRSRPGIRSFYTSYVPKPGGPEPFYLGLGFVPNGEVDDGEIVAVYPLHAGVARE